VVSPVQCTIGNEPDSTKGMAPERECTESESGLRQEEPPPPPLQSDNRWLCCAVLFFLCWCPLLVLTPNSDTNVIHRWSCLVPLSQQGHCGIWGQGHVFDGKLHLTRDICKHDQIPEQLKVPVKSKPAKPAAKRAGNQAAHTAYAVFQSSACT